MEVAVVAKAMLALSIAAQKGEIPSESVYARAANHMQALYRKAEKKDLAALACIANQQKQDNRHTFTLKDVRDLYISALRQEIEIPFEVVGHKQLFARLLNDACSNKSKDDSRYLLTFEDTNALLQGKLIEPARTKFISFIALAFNRARQDIMRKGLTEQIEWRKQHYKYDVINQISEYVKTVDLESPFEEKDLKQNYYLEGVIK